jgi:hypothetical protein
MPEPPPVMRMVLPVSFMTPAPSFGVARAYFDRLHSIRKKAPEIFILTQKRVS